MLRAALVTMVLGAAGAGAAEAPAAAVDAGTYRLEAGDNLVITVWKETDLQAEVLIRPDGGMSFPLAGDLVAAGRTVEELRVELESRVRKFVPDAVVTVLMKQPSGNVIYVVGKVLRPGEYPLRRRTDVAQALALAGGNTPFADTDSIKILRRVDGKLTHFEFHYSDIEHGRRLEQNILLQGGDTVVVP